MDSEPQNAFAPEEALARISAMAGIQSSLRSRFEGMTWILWGLVAALQATTLGFLEEAGLTDAVGGHSPASALAHLWIAVGIIASVGVWRAAAVNFDPAISRRRALAFFIGFPALFALSSFGHDHTAIGAGPFGFAAVAAILLVAFAVANPVHFTRRGRWTAALLAFVAGGVAATVWAYGSSGFVPYTLAGAAIGLSWALAGLDALYRA
jgi:hypothetical protein